MARRTTRGLRKIRGFEKELEFELDSKVSKTAQRAIIAGARAAYTQIMKEWPNHTYWSGANNRISITGRPISRIEPSTRPTRAGALAGKFAQVRASELNKLKDIKVKDKDRLIILGNAVPYAANVSFENAKGVVIYNNAAASALARMRSAANRR